jgi:UDP-N-acetylmuramyl pentapeptide phosphotransferase/UDP-N-acetylglucosamine-1-phosphate transferase
MSFIFLLLHSILFVLIINFFLKHFNILIDKKNYPHKIFASKKKNVFLSGGILIFSFILIFSVDKIFIFYVSLIFVIGIFSDNFFLKNPLIRLLLQAIVVSFSVYFLNLEIPSTKISFIDYLLNYKLFSLFFTTFCLLILMNGTNFIDGLNTLVVGYFSCIIIVLVYLYFKISINLDFTFLINFFLVLMVVFFFNFFSIIYLGDTGALILSYVMGVYLINFSANNINISPLFIALLLWYPAFENLFSIIRKILIKKKPFNPDNFHLHQLVYNFIKIRTKIDNFLINSISANIINFYNLIFFILGINFIYSNKYLIYLIIIKSVFYTFLYWFLMKKKQA